MAWAAPANSTPSPSESPATVTAATNAINYVDVLLIVLSHVMIPISSFRPPIGAPAKGIRPHPADQHPKRKFRRRCFTYARRPFLGIEPRKSHCPDVARRAP
jgi:hypothetical protein